MAKDLKVTTAPAAFAPTAKAHNALVDFVSTLQGRAGIKVSISREKIIIELDANSLKTLLSTMSLTVANLTVTGQTVTQSFQLAGADVGTTAVETCNPGGTLNILTAG